MGKLYDRGGADLSQGLYGIRALNFFEATDGVSTLFIPQEEVARHHR